MLCNECIKDFDLEKICIDCCCCQECCNCDYNNNDWQDEGDPSEGYGADSEYNTDILPGA